MANASISPIVAGDEVLAEPLQGNFESILTQLNGNIDSDNLANNAVTVGKIADKAVGRSNLDDGAVHTNHIYNRAVDGSKVLLGSLDGSHISDGAITREKIRDLAINGAKILNECITTNHIMNGTITANDIAEKAIVGSRIADNAVGAAQIAPNIIEATHIKDRSIGVSKLITKYARGVFSFTPSGTGGTSSGTISLPSGVFTSAPHVVVSWGSAGSTLDNISLDYPVSVYPGTVTKDKFNYITKNDGKTTAKSFSWIAIGE